MESEELSEVRELLERAEKETESKLKLSLLEEALGAFNSFASNAETDPRELHVATNLHNVYLRRIIKQVASSQTLESSVFDGYMMLLVLRADPYTKEFLSSDPGMAEATKDFVERYHGFWRS